MGIRLDDETTHYEIIEKNIQELLQYRSKPRKDDEEIKENTITDEGLELIERYFTTMNFDEQERVLAINVDYLLNKTTIQVIVNDNGTPIIPENFKKINCD